MGWPERLQTTGAQLDLTKPLNMSFEPIDIERFVAIKLARQALKAGAGHPTVLNAANEVAVQAFLEGRLKFLDIESVSAQALQSVNFGAISGINDIFELDRTARALAAGTVAALQ
jgi:1-deoxy-D-xylulose-5-phosphate reductoisomerase